MYGFQLAGVRCMTPQPTTTRMIATLRTTMRLFRFADSLMPITSTIVISTDTRIAGRLISEPVVFHPTCAQPATAACTFGLVHHWNGAWASAAGM